RTFGVITRLNLADFFAEEKLSDLRAAVEKVTEGIVVVYGVGAAHVARQWDSLVYLDMARWEIQLRMRRKQVSNLGVNNTDAGFSALYKQAFFVDWRVFDKHKV